ncbi:MAG: hypothetical protein J6Q69_01800 [Clostridia bacterium]|nr:hypothetical protein [Clostridia bacterium]
MKFLKENSYDIIKLYITQIGIAIFSFMIYTAAGMISKDSTVSSTILVIVSLFSTGFFFALLYCSAWEWGGKDKIRQDAGKTNISTLRGMFMSLWANALNFFLTCATMICAAVCMNTRGGFAETFGGLCGVLYRFTAMMYHGIVRVISLAITAADQPSFWFTEAAGFFICSLLCVVATQFGYIMGRNEKKIFNFKSNKKYE